MPCQPDDAFDFSILRSLQMRTRLLPPAMPAAITSLRYATGERGRDTFDFLFADADA